MEYLPVHALNGWARVDHMTSYIQWLVITLTYFDMSLIGKDFCLLSYADWYKPRPQWTQDPIIADDVLSDIIDFDIPPPTADIASMCTGFLSQSSSESMNWIKIPCDYPLFAAGVICKQPVPRIEDKTGT